MKILKNMIIISVLASMLTACSGKDAKQTSVSYTESPVISITQQQTEPPHESTVYDRYPKLSQYDIFSQYYERAEEIVNSMTVEQKVGQMFWIRCPQDKTEALEYIQLYKPGGYVLFANHFENETPYSVQTTLSEFQNTSDFKMALSCDEEGGDVVRISKYSQFRTTPFYSPQTLYQIGGLEEIVRDTNDKCEFLKNLGINVNLAPVADVSTDAKNYIYSRTYGKDAKQTGEYIKESVRAYRQAGVTCVLKHFPGYGSNSDTHNSSSVDYREYSQFTSNDFVPFLEGIKADAPCIMVNHNTVASMDMNNPASLSPQVHEILRSSLGFTGLIITDDLEMSAVNNSMNEVDACLKAVEAGNDILLTSQYTEAIPAVVKAAETGRLAEEHINTSVIRIIAWKLCYGIIE